MFMKLTHPLAFIPLIVYADIITLTVLAFADATLIT